MELQLRLLYRRRFQMDALIEILEGPRGSLESQLTRRRAA